MEIISKADLRRKMKKYREECGSKVASNKICDILIDRFSGYNTCGFYYKLGFEVDLIPAMDKFCSLGKKVYLPKVEGATMRFGRYYKDALVKGYGNIMEPEQAEDVGLDIVFVPGLAFDLTGHRLGYGKGYYDRFLKDKDCTVKVGIAYVFQIVDNIYADENDIKMNYLLNENGVLRVG